MTASNPAVCSAGAVSLSLGVAFSPKEISGALAVNRRRNLTPRNKGSQKVSAPIGVESARRSGVVDCAIRRTLHENSAPPAS